MVLFSKLVDLMAAVREARDDAHSDARKSIGNPWGVLQSRGMEFCVSAAGNKVSEGGFWRWDGSKKGFEADLARLLEKFPEADEVYIEGGFDWAASPRAMMDQDYEPWVSDWAVLVWKKPAAVVAEAA